MHPFPMTALWVRKRRWLSLIIRRLRFMPFFTLLLLLSLVAHSYAKESKLATSPDGRYEVVVTAHADQLDIPFAQIRDKKTRKRFTTDALGYDGHAEIKATWSPDSHVVALN